MPLPASALSPALRLPAIAAGLFGGLLVLRYLGTLGGMRSGLALMCIGMAALPWLVLDAQGRRDIGLKRARSAAWYLPALLAGAAWAVAAYALGAALFGATGSNWFVTVADTYRAYPVAGLSLLQLHLMLTLPAILFSPIGEELFFRGYLQRVLETRCAANTASVIQALLFGVVHLLHHGIVLNAAGFTVLPASAAAWVAFMTGFAWTCAWLRRNSDSVFPAIACHAAFNAAMNSLIFAYLWS